MNVTIYEKQDMYGQRYYTVDPGNGAEKVGVFELPDTDHIRFELRKTDFGMVIVAHSYECEFVVVPRRAGNGRFYVTPQDAKESRCGWMKRVNSKRSNYRTTPNYGQMGYDGAYGYVSWYGKPDSAANLEAIARDRASSQHVPDGNPTELYVRNFIRYINEH